MSTPTTAPHTRPLLVTTVYYLSFIILGLSTAAQGPSLPVLARHTSSPLNQISLIFVFGSLGYLLGSLVSGLLYDRFSGHRIMACVLAVMAGAAFFIPLISTLWVLLAVMFVQGLVSGALDVGCNALLQWTHGPRVGPFMNGLHFFFGAGAFIFPLIMARILSATGDIIWAFWFIALAALPMAVWMWFLPGPPAPAHSDQASAAPVLLFPAALVVTAFFLYVGAEIGFGNWIYTYALELGLGSTVTAAYLTSAFWGVFTLGRLLGVWISTRARPQTILFADLAGCLASLALIAFGSTSSTVLWIGSALLGLCMASIFPTLLMLAAERMQVTGAITGWFLVGSGAGGMFLPWLIGQAFVATGPGTMTTIIFVDLAVNALVVILFVSRKRAVLQTA